MIKLIVYGVIFAAAMTLLALIYNAIGNHFTAPLKVELKACQQATETATNANVSLQRDLAAQKEQIAISNKAVADLQSQSDARIARSQAAVAAALSAAKARDSASATTIASLKATAASKGNDNGCAAVDKLLTDLANDRVRYGPSPSVVGPGTGDKSTGHDSLRIH